MKAEELRARYVAGERDFGRADLNEVQLSRANLSRTNLASANLASANLIDADLSGACLNRAHLYGANLHRANLTGATLTDANLYRANLNGATLTSRVARSGQWAFEDTVWPTDPALLEGTTVDGVPFSEFMETVRAIGTDPSPQTVAAWTAMQSAKAARAAMIAVTRNDPAPSVAK